MISTKRVDDGREREIYGNVKDQSGQRWVEVFLFAGYDGEHGPYREVVMATPTEAHLPI